MQSLCSNPGFVVDLLSLLLLNESLVAVVIFREVVQIRIHLPDLCDHILNVRQVLAQLTCDTPHVVRKLNLITTCILCSLLSVITQQLALSQSAFGGEYFWTIFSLATEKQGNPQEETLANLGVFTVLLDQVQILFNQIL